MLENGEILSASMALKKYVVEQAKKMVRIEFAPWKVLRAINHCKHGGLNITGAAVYRQVQSLKKI